MADVIAPQNTIDFETSLHLRDTRQDIWENGEDVIFVIRKETDIERSKYGGIKNKKRSITNVPLKARVTFNPSDRRLQSLGMIERTDVLVETAHLDWMDLNITWKDFETIKMSVQIEGVKYDIKERRRNLRVDREYMEILFGCQKT